MWLRQPQPGAGRNIQVILDEIAGLEGDAKKLDGELKAIFEGLGYRWGGPA